MLSLFLITMKHFSKISVTRVSKDFMNIILILFLQHPNETE